MSTLQKKSCCVVFLFTDSSYFDGKTIKIIGFFPKILFFVTVALDNPVFVSPSDMT